MRGACLLFCLALTASPLIAAGDDTAVKKNEWRYTLGARMEFPSVAKPLSDTSFKPMFGLRYGRWKLGASTNDDWLQFSGFRKEASLSYDMFDSSKISVGVSLRIHNLDTGSSWKGYESGRRTLRGRLLTSWQLSPHWSVGGELSHDLQNRGDGQTFSIGLAYSTALDEITRLSFNGGFVWASADHWRSANKVSRADQLALVKSDWGNFGLGANLRRAIAPRLSWYINLGRSWNIRSVSDYVIDNNKVSGQIGLLYHNSFSGD